MPKEAYYFPPLCGTVVIVACQVILASLTDGEPAPDETTPGF
jgi:hypothetical protein